MFHLLDFEKSSYISFEIFLDCITYLEKSRWYNVLFSKMSEIEKSPTLKHRSINDFINYMKNFRENLPLLQKNLINFQEFNKVCQQVGYRKHDNIKEIFRVFENPNSKLMNYRGFYMNVTTSLGKTFNEDSSRKQTQNSSQIFETPVKSKYNRFDGNSYKSFSKGFFSFFNIFLKIKIEYSSKSPLSQVTNRFDSIRKKNEEFPQKKQKKEQFFKNISESKTKFKNNSSSLVDNNIRTLLNILKNYLVENKIRASHLFQKFDLNRDNILSFNEFCSGFMQIGLNLSTSDCLDIFRYFDKRGDGSISIQDFFEALFEEKPSKLNKSSAFMPLLDSKSVGNFDENEDSDEKINREKAFELITIMKKYAKLKSRHIYDYFKIFEEKHQKTIDFNQFLSLLEKMEFLITRSEAKHVFDVLLANSTSDIPENEILWTDFYDCLTETVDLEEFKKEILRHLERSRINLESFFKNFDLNQNGTLSFQEFKMMLNEMIPELNFVDIYEVFLSLDKTKDDAISYEEFEAFLFYSKNSYSIENPMNINMKSDIKFLMNCLRKSALRSETGLKGYFEDYLMVDQTVFSFAEFKNIILEINSSINNEEFECILNYFLQFQTVALNENFLDFTLFYLFLDCPVDFFSVFYEYHELKKKSGFDFEYIFSLVDLNEDGKLDILEYNNFLKKINIEQMNIKHYVEVYYFLTDPNQNYISKLKLHFFLENFEESQEIVGKKAENISTLYDNVQEITFQKIKNDKNSLKKYFFFKFSDVFPFLMDLNYFIKKEFESVLKFEEKIKQIFSDFLIDQNPYISKIQFKLRLLKLHSFFNPLKLNKTLEILNNPKNNNTCDLEEFLFLVKNFEEIFYSKLNLEKKIVNTLKIFYFY